MVTKQARRLIEIARTEGVKEAASSMIREIIGLVRWQSLRWKKQRDYYLRDIHGSKMYLDINDPGVSRDLIIRGMRERSETRMIQEVLKPGMTVVDIGANIGYYALMEARIVTESGVVYAIEPEPHNFDLLKKNVKLNNYQHVKVFQMGIGDTSGEAQLFISSHSNLHNFIRPLQSKDSDSVMNIDICRFDDFVEQQNIDPSTINFIRMDIEGYEVKALKGMERTLYAADALNLFVEFHPQYIRKIPGYNLEKTMDLLASLGFIIKYATATAIKGGSIEFENVTIRDFLGDERVSREIVFMAFLSNN